jgi:hypothetical protein
VDLVSEASGFLEWLSVRAKRKHVPSLLWLVPEVRQKAALRDELGSDALNRVSHTSP